MPVNYTTTASGIHVPTSANNGTDFALGAKQMGDDIDAKLIHATGRAVAAGQSLTTSYADVTGTSFTVTPVVSSHLLLVAHFTVTYGQTASASAQSIGVMSVDGTDDDSTVGSAVTEQPIGLEVTLDGTLLRRYTLAAGSHTIKARAKYVVAAGSPAAPFLTFCEVLYLLTPQ